MIAATAAIVAMLVGVALPMQMVVVMGMLMVVAVGMGMLMAMDLVPMGMLMSVGMGMLMVMSADMIMMKMHDDLSFSFFLYYNPPRPICQSIYDTSSPPGACEIVENGV